MESYSHFMERITYQKPDLQMGEGYFHADGRVLEKVDDVNCFSGFYGDTVVFTIDSDDEAKKKIADIINVLYKEVPFCLAQKLSISTLHMTLHDLSASANNENVSSDVAYNGSQLKKMLAENPIKSEAIKMKTHFIINMVNTSLVMALVPENEEEWNKLQRIYDLIDKVRVCPYPYLTPHITLAYYNRYGFNEQAAYVLKSVVKKLNKNSFDITLSTDDIFYQTFTDMNTYNSEFSFTKI